MKLLVVLLWQIKKAITCLVFVLITLLIRLEIGNKTGISNEMHAYVLREKKKNYLETT